MPTPKHTLLNLLITLTIAGATCGTAAAQMISPAVPPASDTSSANQPNPDCFNPVNGQPQPCASAPSTSPPPSRMTGFVTGGSGPSGSEGALKVLSYFQRGAMKIDTTKAFGLVLLPKSAITESERALHNQFCQIMLASLDFVTPEGAAEQHVLATYWPLISSIEASDIEAAFKARDCESLVSWYDHSLARGVAAKAGVLGLSGPLLITWPSQSFLIRNPRDPLIVDFAHADYQNATKALAHWFKQVSKRPDLWTNYIREGTIRAELADAINDTAGVVVAVLAGKWESISAVTAMP